MRKSILYVLSFFIAFSSCKKDHHTPGNNTGNSGKLYNVTFNLSGFTQAIVNNNAGKKTDNLSDPSDTSSTDKLDILYYNLYSSDKTFLHQKKINSVNGSFATLADSIPTGNYYVVVVAGKTGLTYSKGSDMTENGFNYPAISPLWHDTFAAGLSLSVNSSNLTTKINLTRVVADLEINIKDAIPANTDHITLGVSHIVPFIAIGDKFYTVNGTWDYSGELNPAIIDTIPASAIGKTNYTIDNIIAPDVTNDSFFSAAIKAYDTSGNLIGIANVGNFVLGVNKKTMLSGNLFGGSGATGNSVPIVVNTQWQVTPYKTIGF